MSQINREDALNVLKIAYDTCGADIDTFYKTAMGAIKTLPSAEPWIPCEKELPEIYESVLTSDKYGRVCENYRLYGDDGVEWCHGTKNGTTAWKPLPKPYKGEEK